MIESGNSFSRIRINFMSFCFNKFSFSKSLKYDVS